MRVDEHTIALAGVNVFYRGTPDHDVPAVYVHGTPTSSDDWLPFLELTGGVAPDLPGFGRSDKGGHLDYSIEGQATVLEELLDGLGIDELRLVGHSWGAAAGLVFALRHPRRVTRLVLIDALPLMPGFAWHRAGRVWRTPGVGELVMGSVSRWMLERALRRASATPDAWTEKRLNAVWEQFDQGTQRAIIRQHRAADPDRLAGAGLDLGELDAPALILWGEQDPWFDPRFADGYAALLAGGRAERVAEAGHWPWLDQPEVVQRVARFLNGE